MAKFIHLSTEWFTRDIAINVDNIEGIEVHNRGGADGWVVCVERFDANGGSWMVSNPITTREGALELRRELLKQLED